MDGGERLLRIAPSTGDLITRAKVRRRAASYRVDGATEIRGEDQNRGNSGVLLMSRYGQVLDSSGTVTYADGQAGSLYGQWPRW